MQLVLPQIGKRKWSAILAILALLFQSFAPLVQAAANGELFENASDTKNGYFTTLCTLHGIQTVWVSLPGSEEQPAHYVPNSYLQCPFCLLHAATSAYLPTEKVTLFPTTIGADQFATADRVSALPKPRWMVAFAIRAPPENRIF